MPEGAGGTAAVAGNGAGEMMSAVAADTGVLCLTMMLRFLKLPADPEQIRHERSPKV